MQTDLWRRENQRSIPLWLPALAAALLIARMISLHMQTRGATTDLVDWVPYQQARGRAVASRKLILYDFSAEWCRPCHLMDDEVFRDPLLAKKINDRFVSVRVMDRRQEDGMNSPPIDALQHGYSVRAFPTIVVADAYGNLRQKMEGFTGKQTFEQMIDGVR